METTSTQVIRVDPPLHILGAVEPQAEVAYQPGMFGDRLYKAFIWTFFRTCPRTCPLHQVKLANPLVFQKYEFFQKFLEFIQKNGFFFQNSLNLSNFKLHLVEKTQVWANY